MSYFFFFSHCRAKKICIYEKDYEQYKKHDIPIADAEVKNRFEIRLKNERAFYACLLYTSEKI